ncbi:hypothetical protein CEXT_8841 [Caerostris extrusa]|uniref:Uncharacterized protein n=1 Tax=Caerostris extrusa TaxID=172846 RepID=A0AAV4QTX2_CAEEX|nr:hypothetical protein CEXT_8841 [Caerostris extrusa]
MAFISRESEVSPTPEKMGSRLPRTFYGTVRQPITCFARHRTWLPYHFRTKVIKHSPCCSLNTRKGWYGTDIDIVVHMVIGCQTILPYLLSLLILCHLQQGFFFLFKLNYRTFFLGKTACSLWMKSSWK